ncbi:unnamed protein product, partial [Discosporangium mesarthrocarpum]
VAGKAWAWGGAWVAAGKRLRSTSHRKRDRKRAWGWIETGQAVWGPAELKPLAPLPTPATDCGQREAPLPPQRQQQRGHLSPPTIATPSAVTLSNPLLCPLLPPPPQRSPPPLRGAVAVTRRRAMLALVPVLDRTQLWGGRRSGAAG